MLNEPTKNCLICAETKQVSLFYRDNRSKDLCSSYCKECTKLRVIAAYYKNKEACNARNNDYRRKNMQKIRAIAAKYREKNRKRINEYSNEWVKANRLNSTLNTAKYRTARLQRTPAWLTDSDLVRIKCFYQVAAMRTRESGYDWHVDHIIPLKGKFVSGLHVPNNLRVIPAIENKRKTNIYEVA
jgi:hypothetical protein